VERFKNHTKVKNKREMDRDEYKASKKIRKEEWRRSSRDRDPGCDLANGDVPDVAKTLPGKTMALKGSGERSDVSSSKQKNVSRHNPLEKSKKAKDEDVVLPDDENKDYFHQSDAQRSDLYSKKRIVKEWEDIQHSSVAHISKGTTVNHNSATKETCKDESFREAKLKSLKSEEVFSTMDSKSGKVNAEQMLSYDGGHINDELVEDNTLLTGRGMPELENQLCDQALGMAEPASSGVACLQSIAVTSSSSKASVSQKKKQNTQVAKTSPADSRSSSPQRKYSTEKTPHSRISGKDGSVNMAKQLNTEFGVADNVQRASEPISVGFSRRKSDRDNGHVQLNQGNALDDIHLERSSDDDLQHESGRAKGSQISRGYNHSHSGDKSNYRTDASPLQPGKHIVEPKTTALDAKGDSTMLDNKKSTPSFQDRNGLTHYHPDNTQQVLSGGKDKSHLKSSKQDLQKPKAQIACSPPREAKQESHSTPLKSNMSKLTPQLRQHGVENGGQHGTAKQGTPNPADTSSPAMKDGTSAAYALKEARDLKHKANRLKVVLLSLSQDVTPCLYMSPQSINILILLFFWIKFLTNFLCRKKEKSLKVQGSTLRQR
jgi:hypothetical protein